MTKPRQLTRRTPLKAESSQDPTQWTSHPREPSNTDRAAWAATALHAFRHQTGADPEDALADLLADLMHWCDSSGHDFETEFRRAAHHYECEAGNSFDWLPPPPEPR